MAAECNVRRALKLKVKPKLKCQANIAIYIPTFQFLFPIDTPNIDGVTASLALKKSPGYGA